jgi:hypothetical protein
VTAALYVINMGMLSLDVPPPFIPTVDIFQGKVSLDDLQ